MGVIRDHYLRSVENKRCGAIADKQERDFVFCSRRALLACVYPHTSLRSELALIESRHCGRSAHLHLPRNHDATRQPFPVVMRKDAILAALGSAQIPRLRAPIVWVCRYPDRLSTLVIIQHYIGGACLLLIAATNRGASQSGASGAFGHTTCSIVEPTEERLESWKRGCDDANVQFEEVPYGI